MYTFHSYNKLINVYNIIITTKNPSVIQKTNVISSNKWHIACNALFSDFFRY